MRTFHMSVVGDTVTLDSAVAGVQGSGNVDKIVVAFDGNWDGCAKSAAWWDARGAQAGEPRLLTAEMLVDPLTDQRTYVLVVPPEALRWAGMCTLVIDGYREGTLARTVAQEFQVAAAPAAAIATPVTPTQAQQLQEQIEGMVGNVAQQTEDAAAYAQAAELAKENARGYCNAAQIARDEAKAAKTGIQEAQQATETLRDEARAARNEAVTQRTLAETAKTAAQTAKTQAEAARDSAWEAAQEAAQNAAEGCLPIAGGTLTGDLRVYNDSIESSYIRLRDGAHAYLRATEPDTEYNVRDVDLHTDGSLSLQAGKGASSAAAPHSNVELAASGDVAVQAGGGLSLSSTGELKISGDTELATIEMPATGPKAGNMELEADQTVHARGTEVELEGQDAVRLRGEKIQLFPWGSDNTTTLVLDGEETAKITAERSGSGSLAQTNVVAETDGFFRVSADKAVNIQSGRNTKINAEGSVLVDAGAQVAVSSAGQVEIKGGDSLICLNPERTFGTQYGARIFSGGNVWVDAVSVDIEGFTEVDVKSKRMEFISPAVEEGLPRLPSDHPLPPEWGGRVNPNLLDNWYFADPINQRGETEYNTANAYAIDRWLLLGGGALSLNTQDRCVDIVQSAHGWDDIEQRIPNYQEFIGREVTLSFLFRGVGGSPYALRARKSSSGAPYTKQGAATGEVELAYYTFTLADDASAFSVIFQPGNGSDINSDHFQVYAAKLELGAQQTLAHQDADGNWVLNDPPPNKQQELAKCQRYYFKSTDGRYPYIANADGDGGLLLNISLPVTMRTTPSITFIDTQRGQPGYVRNANTGAPAACQPGTITGNGSHLGRCYGGTVDTVAGNLYDFGIIADADL